MQTAHITLGELDRVDPALNASLSEGSEIKVIRIREEFYVKQNVIPFKKQELQNEALPEGERRLSQPGANGLEEVTYRKLFEDGIEVSDSVYKIVTLKEALPEVVMVGIKPSQAPIDIPGRMAYFSAGNAWLMEGTTADKRLVISTGDLDGRIFSLSRDGKWLLFSRSSSASNSINSLWAADLESNPIDIIDLGVSNVVHYAEFSPDASSVAFSSVEWRETTPGWQANNDLSEVAVSESGVGPVKIDLEANSGGIYGWWGMEFAWAPGGDKFLYSRPDGIGILDPQSSALTTLLNMASYHTGGNWAWVPGAAWSPDDRVIYAVDHASASGLVTEDSQQFDLIAIPLDTGKPLRLDRNVGMFAYPVVSPVRHELNYLRLSSDASLDQEAFRVAYLKAIDTEQSETSLYRLYQMDRDGSNRSSLFPMADATGLDPQHVVWSPEPMTHEGDYAIAFIYNGNIWLVDSASGVAHQVTGDGLVRRIDWR